MNPRGEGRRERVKKLRANGLEIAYEDLGGSHADLRPLVLVHGFTGHREDFEGAIPALAQERRVLVPDLRGHGDSGRCDLADYHFDALVGDLLAFLDALSIERCDLLGHSMGGMVALRFVLLHSDRVVSLVLMNTSPTAPESIGAPGFERALTLAREVGMPELQRRAEKAGRKMSDAILERRSEPYWTHHRKRYLAMDADAFAGLGRAMLDQVSLVSRLHEIRQPTLVLVGESDRDFLAGADLLEQGIASARRVTIPAAGHHPHQENLQPWLDALLDHLRAND
jgi:pimeloyl-ACP methyl ester carboxylesterase